MRITILTHGVMPFGRQYAALFSKRGHKVELLSLSPCAPVEGVETRVVGTLRPWDGDSRIGYARCVLPVRRAIRDFRPDIVFAMYLSSAGLLASVSGHRRIVLSALGSDVNTHTQSRVWRNTLRWACGRAQLVHAVSQPLADSLVAHFGVHPSKIIVSAVGVDTKMFAFTDPSSRPGAGRILYTRAHSAVYDPETLVRAMVILKGQGVPFHVTFTHRELGRTRHMVEHLGVEDRATFIPGYEYRALPSILGSHDIYVSCSRMDGTSQSLLEAMGTGLFPVVSDIPANKPWIGHGINGYLFPAGDPRALAERLREALSRPDLRLRASSISRDSVLSSGDADKEADKLLATFEQIGVSAPAGLLL